MPRVKQLVVSVENQPGKLGRVTSAFGAARVDILAFVAGPLDGRDAIRLIVDRAAAARKVCAESRWPCEKEDVVEVTLGDKPGTLGPVARKLGEAGINIRYAYTGTAKSATKVNAYFAVDDVAGAMKAMR
jgi:hypothetical protein